MGTLVTEVQYLPLIEYFVRIKNTKEILWAVGEKYQKQTLRNRTYILTANGTLKLTVPVIHHSSITEDVKIDYSQGWIKDHTRGIVSAYKHAPYFDYYYPYFEKIYLTKPEFLVDLNELLVKLCFKIMKKDTVLKRTNMPIDVDDRQHDKIQFKPYLQVFGSGFSPNQSIIDLLFNKGPDSKDYL